MAETVLLIGNGVNNITNKKSWEALLKSLYDAYYDKSSSFDEIKKKPFPLVYEQIVAHQLKKRKGERIESVIREKIAGDVKNIIPNMIHNMVANGKWNHVMTTNYEFNLMNNYKEKKSNMSEIRESKYSIFRRFKDEGGRRIYWHLHGDAQNTNSINLGYEHYCGQLQRMREYVTGGYRVTDKQISRLFKIPLLKRNYLNSGENHSWIDFFFKDNVTIKIAGLKLDMEEIDICWLPIYRAKIMYGAKSDYRIPVNNEIIYYVPEMYTKDKKGNPDPGFKSKKDLMEKMDIKVKVIPLPHSEDFYKKALK